MTEELKPDYGVFEDGTVNFFPENKPAYREFTRTPGKCNDVIGPALTTAEIARLYERDIRAGNNTNSNRKLTAFHWQNTAELPGVVFATPSPTLDNNIAHDSRVQRDNVVGTFCGAPIITLDEVGMDVDVVRDQNRRLSVSSGQSIPPEVLPGEEVCSDNVIRRTTTAEAMGYETYHNQAATELGTKRGGIEEGRLAADAGKLVMWRPNRDTNPSTEYVLIHEEGQ